MTQQYVYIVDDDEAIRDSLSWLLQSRSIASLAFPSAEDFLEAWTPALTGCILLDIRMERMSGTELFERLLELGCNLPVIFLTGHGDVPMAVSTLKTGAFDFFEKPCNDNELVDRVVEALEINKARCAATASADSINSVASVSCDDVNKIIASELQISMRTVEVHRASLFDKMGVRTAVELAQTLAAGPGIPTS